MLYNISQYPVGSGGAASPGAAQTIGEILNLYLKSQGAGNLTEIPAGTGGNLNEYGSMMGGATDAATGFTPPGGINAYGVPLGVQSKGSSY